MSLLETVAEPAPADDSRPGTWHRFWRTPAAVAAGALVGFFLLVALLAPVLAPHGVADADLSRVRPGFVPGPSAGHPLGLDNQGRDELSRLVYGARSSLVIAVGSVALGAVLGGLIGAVAGGFGGWAETVIMRLVDVLLAIPGLLFAVGLAALLGPSLPSVMIAIGVAGVPVVARLLRSVIVVEREKPYVDAARAAGATRWRTVTRHILPNAVGPVLATVTLAMGSAVLTAAGLAFLGLGPSNPSVPEWGRMLSESEGLLQTAPQLVFLPGVAIVLVVLGFNLLGDAVRAAVDPKDRQ